MIINQKFLDTVGRRSPIAREAMAQAGDKLRIETLKNFLVSVGSCEITFEEIKNLGLPVYEKTFSFMANPLIYVLLDKTLFQYFSPFTDPASLEIAHIHNGVIGVKKGEKYNAEHNA